MSDATRDNTAYVKALEDALRHYADESSWELEADPGPEISTAYYPIWFYHGNGTSQQPWDVAREALNAR